MADCMEEKDELLLHDDVRVQHIATVSSTLLQHSREALLATLQHDAAARQCLTRFLAGSGERRRAPAACLRPRTPCSRTLAQTTAGSSALLVCLEREGSRQSATDEAE